MKLNLKLSGETGTVCISLDKNFNTGEVEKITTFLSDLVNGTNVAADPNAPVIPKEYRLKFNSSAPSALDNKIGAIKIMRAHTGFGLREAKDIVEGTLLMPATTATGIKALTEELNRAGVCNFQVQEVAVS